MISVILGLFLFASGNHSDHHGKSHRFGPEKAILDVDENKGFKLSQESRKLLKIKTQKISSLNREIPPEATVYIKDKKGFYVLRQGYFKFQKMDEKPKIGDKIVVEGKEIIAISDIFSTDQSEYGHSH